MEDRFGSRILTKAGSVLHRRLSISVRRRLNGSDPTDDSVKSLAKKGRHVAREIIERFVSDLSGKEIPAGKSVTVTLSFEDGRRNKVELDASESEVADLIRKGREIKRRGRPPRSINRKPSANGNKSGTNGRRKRRSATS